MGRASLSPLPHRVKEFAERLSGHRIHRAPSFPFVGAERRFLTLRLDLHNKCNLRCTMCYLSLDAMWKSPLVEMEDEVIERMVSELWPVTRELWLSCTSEPLIGRKLDALLPRIKPAGVPNAQMVTNAQALTEAKARLLIESGLDRLHVSIDGATAPTYEAIRINASFDRLLANLRRLAALKAELRSATPALSVGMVLMRDNMNEWADIVRLAADLGADKVSLSPQIYFKELAPREHFWDYPDQVNAELARVHEAAARLGLEVYGPRTLAAPAPGQAEEAAGDALANAAPPRRGFQYCSNPWAQLLLTAKGDLLPCYQMNNQVHFGNIKTQRFNEIYYGAPWRELRESLRRSTPCATCRECQTSHTDQLDRAEERLNRQILPES